MSIGTKKHEALKALGYTNFTVSDTGVITLYGNQTLDETALNNKLSELESNVYKIKRARKYPKIQEQLDMLWHMMDDEIIPGKGSEWYNAILAVKTAHPKPE